MDLPQTNGKKSARISIVVPCFRSPPGLVQLVDEIKIVIQHSQLVSSYEIILVADGPESYQNLLVLFPRVPQSVKIVSLAHNYGEQIALIAGVMEAGGNYVCTLDDDGQHPASVIELLLRKKVLSGFGLIYGQDGGVSQPFGKHVAARSFKGLLDIFLAAGASQISSVRLFDRAPVAAAVKDLSDPAIVLDGVLLQVFRDFSSTVVDFNTRGEGRSGYKLKSLMDHTLNLAMTVAQRPLRALLWLGGSLLVTGIVTGLIVAYDAIFLSNLLPPWGLLGAIASGIVGIQLLGIATVGELTSRLLSEVRGYPLFRVEQRHPNKN
jgi:undecaprenyl-phosphate 4-deoxy-4-formamido-L-arabinose transferase